MSRTRRLGLAAVAFGALLLGSRSMIDWLARSMLYPAPGVPVPVAPPPPLVDRGFETSAGERVAAWASVEGDGPEVLWLHGNGENLATLRRSGLFERFRDLGSPVTALDYPGYGRSVGRPGEEALVAAARELFDRMEEGDPARRRVVAGWSLGAAVAAQLAATRRGRFEGLVLLSAWESLPSVARRHFPGWLVGLGLRDQWATAGVLGKISDGGLPPVLLVHGGSDRLIPVAEGRRVREAVPGARWVELPGAGHNDLLARGAVWRELAAFLGEVADGSARSAHEAG